MVDFAVLENMRLKLYQKHIKMKVFGIVFFITAIISFIFAIFSDSSLLYIFPVLIFCLAIVFLIRAFIQKYRFNKDVKPEIINYIIKDMELFSEMKYLPYHKIDMEKITLTGLVKKPDLYSGEDYIEGKYKNVFFEVSDAILKEEVQTHSSSGTSTTHYETYFRGRWYIYYFDKPIEGLLQIAQRRPHNTRKLRKIETESIQFNKKFRVYTNNQEMAFYLITPLMLERLMLFEKANRGKICLGFIKNQLHVGVNDAKDYLELKFKKPINREDLQYLIDDFELISNIIDEFRLYTPKFMKRKGEA
jgi:hypothetical protein